MSVRRWGCAGEVRVPASCTLRRLPGQIRVVDFDVVRRSNQSDSVGIMVATDDCHRRLARSIGTVVRQAPGSELAKCFRQVRF